MFILIPLIFVTLVFLGLKWVCDLLNLKFRVFVAAIGTGVVGYILAGAMIPHTDPQLWHYLIAPVIGGLVMGVGWVPSIRARLRTSV